MEKQDRELIEQAEKRPDVKEWETEVKKDGFIHTFLWHDPPNTFYAEHTHKKDTAHVILQGEMVIEMQGKLPQVYFSGQRVDVPALLTHSAEIGPEGCTYLVGEK